MKTLVVIFALLFAAIIVIHHFVPTLDPQNLNRTQAEQLRAVGQ